MTRRIVRNTFPRFRRGLTGRWKTFRHSILWDPSKMDQNGPFQLMLNGKSCSLSHLPLQGSCGWGAWQFGFYGYLPNLVNLSHRSNLPSHYFAINLRTNIIQYLFHHEWKAGFLWTNDPIIPFLITFFSVLFKVTRFNTYNIQHVFMFNGGHNSGDAHAWSEREQQSSTTGKVTHITCQADWPKQLPATCVGYWLLDQIAGCNTVQLHYAHTEIHKSCPKS